MCFANAVLQILVHSPPLWNLFRQLGDLRGTVGPETGGGATPLVDATVRFFEEFMFREKESPPPTQVTQDLVRQAAKGKPRKDEVEKKDNEIVDSLEPTYLYEAMKEKRRLKHLLVRSRCQDVPS
jgi:ubiquitin carboxyl-terminal hydrolase 10